MPFPQQLPRHRNDRPTGELLEPTPATPRAGSVGVDPCLASFPAAVAVVTPRDCGDMNKGANTRLVAEPGRLVLQ
jgi:hypothetical protein